MILRLQIDDVTEKDADDVANDVLLFLRDELGIMVADYWLEDE